MNATFGPPPPWNEPVLGYAPGSDERRALKTEIDRMAREVVEITPRIAGQRVATGRTARAVMPHDHGHVLATWHQAGSNEVGRAIDAARRAAREWSRGKDFVFAHASADPAALATALVRGAFEYQGQKCSAASRAFIPTSPWPAVRERLLAQVARIRTGDVRDFTNFMGAVIDGMAFTRIQRFIDVARRSPDAQILAGGGGDDRTGFFIEPTVILTRQPDIELMREEIFGPVLTVWLYDEHRLDEALRACDEGTRYGLTGSIFAQGRAGSVLNLLRWVSARTIKETFVPPTDFPYPFMRGERSGGEPG